jgi:hypothetical protein
VIICELNVIVVLLVIVQNKENARYTYQNKTKHSNFLERKIKTVLRKEKLKVKIKIKNLLPPGVSPIAEG